MATVAELKEYIKENVDEVQLLELLDLSVEELVDAFEEKIEERKVILETKLEV